MIVNFTHLLVTLISLVNIDCDWSWIDEIVTSIQFHFTFNVDSIRLSANEPIYQQRLMLGKT